MKQFAILFFVLALAGATQSQPIPDSVLVQYKAAVSKEDKGRCLMKYLYSLVSDDTSGLNSLMKIRTYFKKQKDETGADYAGLLIANEFGFTGDYTTGLNIALPILSQFEKREDKYGIIISFRIIGGCYEFSQNFEQANIYYKKIIPIAESIGDKERLSVAYNDIGVAYAKASMPDSGLVYAQKAVNIDSELKNEGALTFSLSTLAENYIAQKDYDLAMPFLRKALRYGQSASKQWGVSYIYNDFAQAFLGMGQTDSANYYAHRAIQLCKLINYKEQLVRSYEYLYKSFEAANQTDSVNKYFRLAMSEKDSLYSIEKTRNVQTMSFHEQMRQQEIETEKQKAEEERQQNIQYALIAPGIITFIILLLLLSRTMIANTRLIEFLGILALLIVFEFLNLLLHPFIERITNHTPLFMLLALVLIAALLIPLHHSLEKWSTKKLVEKNKQIRLANAKKTIEQLENEK